MRGDNSGKGRGKDSAGRGDNSGEARGKSGGFFRGVVRVLVFLVLLVAAAAGGGYYFRAELPLDMLPLPAEVLAFLDAGDSLTARDGDGGAVGVVVGDSGVDDSGGTVSVLVTEGDSRSRSGTVGTVGDLGDGEGVLDSRFRGNDKGRDDKGRDDERLDGLHRQLDGLERRLGALEKRVAAVAESGGGGDSAPAVMQLQFIDLALRATGNSGAAAAALDSLADAAGDEARGRLLRAEARRLRKMPERKRITDSIGKLRELLAETDDIPAPLPSPGDGAAGFFRELLKVQKLSEGKTRAAGLDASLERMELLILAGRRGEYLRELSAAAEHWRRTGTAADDGNIALLFSRLEEIGAPRYRLGTVAAGTGA